MDSRRETLMRILNLMQQGTVTPEEAAELIDALYEVSPTHEASQASSETATAETSGGTSPVRGLFDQILRAAEEAVRATGQAVRRVDWQQIGRSVREQTQRSLEELRKVLQELEQGDWSLGRWSKYEVDLHQTMDFAIGGGQSLSIDLPAGDLHIIGGFDGGRVEAAICLRGANPQAVEQAKARYSLTIEQTDEGVRIRAPELEGDIRQKVDLTLRIPRQVNLRVRLEHKGDIEVEKLDGSVDLRTPRGDMHLRHLRGSATLETVNGDIHLTDLQGDRLALTTVNGDVWLSEVKIDSGAFHLTNGDLEAERLTVRTLKAEAVRGSLTLELLEPVRGDIYLTTVSGDIVVALPDGNDCRVQLQTSAGDIECDLECRAVERGRHFYRGVAGDGTGTLTLEAVHGNLRVRLRSHETA
ncbi:MAG: DUF4097 domain-containing protein [Fimbriimonadales bacterium]|nr:DUF4097 domain-containing protein [Fimbriimonadales bacterium]MDW8050994.1 DUF4097 family beta strand repeat-containing protein [Armatimonadota bacterium]